MVESFEAYVNALDGRDDVRELWAAPKTGGPAVKRATFSGQPNGLLSTVTSAFEVDDALFVSFAERDPSGHDEVHRVRADGTTEKVPGTDGWRTGWPTPPPWLIQSPDAENAGQRAFWNVGTGHGQGGIARAVALGRRAHGSAGQPVGCIVM